MAEYLTKKEFYVSLKETYVYQCIGKKKQACDIFQIVPGWFDKDMLNNLSLKGKKRF